MDPFTKAAKVEKVRLSCYGNDVVLLVLFRRHDGE